jgi:glycosyltransferase involved in cell wall biosynthesis
MKILQVSAYESPGRRFNGLSITPLLKKHGIESQHLVLCKDTENPAVLTLDGKAKNKLCQIFRRKANYLFNRVINRIEWVISLQAMLYPHAKQIMKMQAFQEADLLHLHIIHSGFFSLRDLPKITALKPTVWTLHDPWAMTGHCIYPFNCNRWQTGCGSCPDLKTPIPLLFDTTRFLFNYKHRTYRNAKFDIIVASKWMQNMVKLSPLMENTQVHYVPFGLDLDFWNQNATSNARERFGISANALVICFRAVDNSFKGLPYIIQTLERIQSKQPICLLTMEKRGLLQQFAGRFQLVELGWINDEICVRDAFIAADIFLMPSTVEAFGMMAIEAMACSKPVISFEGTSLPEVTFAPEVGVSVPMKDTDALFQALQTMIDNPTDRKERGRKGRVMAEIHYNEKLQAQRLAEIYKMVVEENSPLKKTSV